MEKSLIFVSSFLVVSTSLLAQVKTISPEKLQNLINDCKHDTNYVLLDVRDVNEVKNGIIASKYCKPYHLSFNTKELERNYTILPGDIPIYIYCRSGNRSMQAATFLNNKGFKEVYSMEGGINAYKGELYDSTEFKKWSPLTIIEPSFVKGNCTSILENSYLAGSGSITELNEEPVITVNKTIFNKTAIFILSGKSIPELKAIKIIGSYDPDIVSIKEAIVSVKIPECAIEVLVDTNTHKISFLIKGADKIKDNSNIMELTLPLKINGDDKFNFIEAEIIDKNGKVIKVNLQRNSVLLPYVKNENSKFSEKSNFYYILLNGRLSNVKSCRGIFVELNKEIGVGTLNLPHHLEKDSKKKTNFNL